MLQTRNTFYTPTTNQLVASIAACPQGLEVQFSDGDTRVFDWFWVRDHGIDEASLDQDTLQRKVDTFALPRDVRCKTVDFNHTEQICKLDWNDGEETTISAFMLASVVNKAPGRHALAPAKKRVLWDKDSKLLELPSVEYDAVMESDDGLLEWLENIHVYGFSLVDGVPTTEAATTKMAKRVGRVQETIFGKMWPLSSDLTDHGDTAYSTSYLEPHTDGTYYDDAAGLQMFSCLEIDAKVAKAFK